MKVTRWIWSGFFIMASLLILEDHPIVVLGLREILKTIPGMVIAGMMANGRQFLDALSKRQIDLVILEVWLGDCSTLEVLKELKRCCPAMGALVYSARTER